MVGFSPVPFLAWSHGNTAFRSELKGFGMVQMSSVDIPAGRVHVQLTRGRSNQGLMSKPGGLCQLLAEGLKLYGQNEEKELSPLMDYISSLSGVSVFQSNLQNTAFC